MKDTLKREFPLHFAKGKKIFNIVVHMSDEPGSMGAILDALGKRVNMIGTSSYTLNDGTAMFTSFAEALSSDETPATLKALLDGISTNLESDVIEGRDGLLVDTFHTGILVGGDKYLLIMREGFSAVFDHIVRLFDTGGEVLLYEEGKALGHDSSQRRTKELGDETVTKESAYLDRALTAQGWGVVETDNGKSGFQVVVEDCFECSGAGKVRKGCDFLRGYYEGLMQSDGGPAAKLEEVECRLRGGKKCVFRAKS